MYILVYFPIKKHKNQHTFYYQQINAPRFDCGSILGYIEANIAFAVNDNAISHEVKKIITKYL